MHSFKYFSTWYIWFSGRSIWHIGKTLTGTPTPGQSRRGSNGNGGATPQSRTRTWQYNSMKKVMLK